MLGLQVLRYNSIVISTISLWHVVVALVVWQPYQAAGIMCVLLIVGSVSPSKPC